MERPQLLQQFVDWLRAGYPNGIPTKEYVPIFAILARKLTDEEITKIVESLKEMAANRNSSRKLDIADAAVAVTKQIDQLPDEHDLEKINRVLAAADIKLANLEFPNHGSPKTE